MGRGSTGKEKDRKHYGRKEGRQERVIKKRKKRKERKQSGMKEGREKEGNTGKEKERTET